MAYQFNFETLNIVQKGSVFTLLLNRPAFKNAFNAIMISELTSFFSMINELKTRLIILKGQNNHFCAGADLNWMKASYALKTEDNLKECQALYQCFYAIKHCPVPVVCIVEGAALGGAIGLVSACDYVMAEQHSFFSLSEIKLGLVPAIIGPFVLEKIGSSHTRSLFLTAERFDAQKALQIGLVHQLVDSHNLLSSEQRMIQNLLLASPKAVRTAKSFIHSLADLNFESKGDLAIETLASVRQSEEAQEGMAAFLEKRDPKWRLDS